LTTSDERKKRKKERKREGEERERETQRETECCLKEEHEALRFIILFYYTFYTEILKIHNTHTTILYGYLRYACFSS
jgi:hypothetical protein